MALLYKTLGLRDLVGQELQIVMRLLELRLLPVQHLKERSSSPDLHDACLALHVLNL